ncbi:hypothetical protein LX32DRAFT_637504, partial [Colletotrichum zoysiae]
MLTNTVLSPNSHRRPGQPQVQVQGHLQEEGRQEGRSPQARRVQARRDSRRHHHHSGHRAHQDRRSSRRCPGQYVFPSGVPSVLGEAATDKQTTAEPAAPAPAAAAAAEPAKAPEPEAKKDDAPATTEPAKAPEPGML